MAGLIESYGAIILDDMTGNESYHRARVSVKLYNVFLMTFFILVQGNHTLLQWTPTYSCLKCRTFVHESRVNFWVHVFLPKM